MEVRVGSRTVERGDPPDCPRDSESFCVRMQLARVIEAALCDLRV